MLASGFQTFWRNRPAVMALVVICFGLAWLGVYASGGTKFAQLHLIYIPIIIASFRFNIWGGIVGGIIGTFLMGPLMPLDVASDQAQTLSNWLSRGGYLTGFGIVIGVLHSTILKSREELYRIANYDPITQLPLFEAFRRNVSAAMASGAEGQHRLVILNIELANSQEIVSSFGSQLYEELMKACAERVADVLPEDSYIARGSPTRFLALLKDAGADDAMRYADAMIATFEEEVIAEGAPVHVMIRIGVACYPEHGEDTDELVRASHSALSEAANSAAHVLFFDSSRDTALRQNLAILSELNAALTNGDIYFAAQPKISLRDYSLIGAELLVRWRHPQRGFIPPSEFIPMVEKSRFIAAITQASLKSARDYIRDCAAVPGIPAFHFAVNVTGRDVTDPAFPDDLAEIFDDDRRLLGQLELEITETAVIEDFSEALPVLERLRRMGVHIAIDDFGTGFSSLNYLKDIPADTLKIDQSFVRGVMTSDKDEILVRRTIELARDLGLRTVAEGVETEEIANWLWAAGCDIAQGYFYAKPLDPGDWSGWLEAYQAGEAVGTATSNA